MSKLFKKENLKPLVVLGLICIIVAVLLAAVNVVTGPIIKKAEEQKVYDSLREALDGEFAPIELPANSPDTVTGLYKVTDGETLIGHVVTLEKQGYASKIVLTVGIKADGTINKVVITSQQETHQQNINPLINGFAGVSEEGVADVEHVSQATFTSNHIKNAVADAFKALSADTGESGDDGEEEEEEALPRTDEELLTLAGELVEGAELENVTPENMTYAKRIYRAKGGKGYVAYVFVISENYGTVESEALIHIGTDGKIKNINKLTWKTSDAIYGYVPPTQEQADAFYDRLVGSSSDTIGEVELVSNATNTSNNVIASFTEALDAVNELIKLDLPRPEEEIESLAASMVGDGAELENVTPEGMNYAKRIYRDKGGNGYVAYVFVISENYGTVESEALIYVGNNGKIKDVQKLTWKTSDAIYGYVPPTQEQADAFFDRLVGNSSETIGDVELVSNATNTSNNVIASFTEALTAVEGLIALDMPRGEEEILTLAGQMVGEGIEFTDVTPDGNKYLKRVYRVSKGKGYVAYVVVISENYGTVESEALIYVGNDGKINDVQKLTWKTSDAIYGYVPPTQEEADAFFERLVGSSSETIGDVELVSNATNTSNNVIASFTEALNAVNELIKQDLPRPEEEIEAFAKDLAGGEPTLTDITPAGLEYVKRLYKLDGGYIVYAVVISPNYGTVESEALIYVSNSGKINSAKKLTWKTSDAIYGYEPPTQEQADDFYASLAGVTADTLGDVELVTNATSTSTRLVEAISEGLEAVNSQAPEKNDAPAADKLAVTVGIVILAVIVVSVAAYIVLPIITKRRRKG